MTKTAKKLPCQLQSEHPPVPVINVVELYQASLLGCLQFLAAHAFLVL